jgi:hypothetical protein
MYETIDETCEVLTTRELEIGKFSRRVVKAVSPSEG